MSSDRRLVRRTSTRRKPRLLSFEGLESRRLLSNVNGIATKGVYDGDLVPPNAVNFVATGSSVTNTQFASQVATAFNQDIGGVIAGGLGTLYNYGTDQSKTLVIDPAGGTNWGTGLFYGNSGFAAFATSAPYNTLSLNFLQIQGGQPYEHVVTFGLTAMSIAGRDYGNVTLTGRLAGGGSVSATRHINDPTGVGDTFYGLSAPAGDYFVGLTLSYSGAVNGTPDTRLWFDDIGFITAQVDRTSNIPPVAANDSYNALPNQTTAIGGAGVLANDSDPAGNPLSTILVSGPSHGSLLLNPDGPFWYTPANGYTGPDSFTYQAFDTQDTSNVATVSLNVAGPVGPPVAVNDSYTVQKGTPLTVSGLPSTSGALLRYGFDEASSGASQAQDSGAAPAAPASFSGAATRTASTPGGGSPAALDLSATGNNFLSAGHVAKLDNLGALTLTGWINLRGTPIDQDVILADDPALNEPAGDGGWDLRITKPYDNNNPLSASNFAIQFGVARVQGGFVNTSGGSSTALSANGQWIFVAATYDANGILTLYRGDTGTAVAQVGNQQSVGLPLGKNTAPFEVGGTAIFPTTDYTPPAWLDDLRVYGSALTAAQLEQIRTQDLGSGVLANDTSPSGQPLTAALVTGPSHGALTLNADGSFTYTPTGSYLGPDSFTYKASDGTQTSAAATVSLTVTGPDDAPTAGNDAFSMTAGNALTITAASLLANDSDINGQPLGVVNVTQPAHGTLVANGSTYTYTPAQGFTGTDSFTYQDSDGTLTSNVATVTITVNPLVGSIRGTLWSDANGNGLLDSTELKLGGRTVYLDQNQDGQLDNGEVSTTTASDGSYAFTGLAPGTYYVAEVVPPGWTQTAPVNSPERTVVIGGSQTTVFDFNELASTADQTIGPYHKAGFTFDSTVNQPTKFRVPGSSDASAWAGSPALESEWVPVTVSLKQDSGAPFTVNSMDLSPTWTSVYTPVVTFVGTKLDGSTVSQSFNVGSTLGFKTYTFTGFNNLASVTWFQHDPTDEVEWDNVSVQSTGPLDITGINFGTQRIADAAPVAVNDTYSTPASTALTVAAPGVLANDSDPDGDPITAVLATGPAHGTLTLNADGSFTYTPTSGYNGPDSFTYKANDGRLNSNAATVTLNVGTFNHPPVANDDSYTVTKSTALTVAAPGVLANDTDNENDPLTARLFSGASHGSVVLNSNGSFTYTPFGAYLGPDSFTYQANDGHSNSNTATVHLTVTGTDDPPIAQNDSYIVNPNTALTVSAPGVLGNDTDPNSQPITAALVSGPSHGTLSLNANGSFTYTPATSYHGADSFTYMANDGQLNSNVATVSLAVDAAPVAVAETYTTNENQALTVAAPGVLGNDSDPDGDPITAVATILPAHGTLTLKPDGSFLYTPNTNFYGTDSFSYQASDGTRSSPSVSDTITVTHVNQPPVASNDTYTVAAGGTLTTAAGLTKITLNSQGDFILQGHNYVYTPLNSTITLSQSAPGNVLQFHITSPTDSWDIDFDSPDGGKFVPGTYTNVARAGFQGPGQAGLDVTGDGRGSNTVTGQFTVTQAVYDSSNHLLNFGASLVMHPDGGTASLSGQVDYNFTNNLPDGVLDNDSDPDPATTLTAKLVAGPSHGALTLNADGSFTYTPASGFTGTDSFTYMANDGQLNSNPATVTINVVQPAPQVLDDGGAGFTETGTGWQGWSSGYGGTHQFVAPAPSGGPATATATWQATSLPVGNYVVQATWEGAGSHADNASYLIYDGATLVQTVTVNQRIDPVGTVYGGRPFQTLATVTISSGTLRVVLGNNADSYVDADAVRLDVPPPANPPPPTTLPAILDDGTANFAETGTGWQGWGSGYGGAHQFVAPAPSGGPATATATWQANGLPVGNYVVQATWEGAGSQADNATYLIYDGATLVQTVIVNQRIDPSGTAYGGRPFQTLATVTISSGTLRVVLGNNADSYVDADAVRLDVPPPANPPPPTTLPAILDDGTANFAETGTGWQGWGSGYGGAHQFVAPAPSGGPATATATWQANGLPVGNYVVQATWEGAGSQADNATYLIYDGATLVQTVTVNQRIDPVGTAYGGRPFQTLATVTISSGTLRVVLGNNADSYVDADAVRITGTS